MKICITSTGTGLDAATDPLFGRARYFLFVDAETGEAEAVENAPGAHGAGVQAAQIVASKGADVVVTGNVGPNAFQGLASTGARIYVGARGSCREALAAYKAGELTRAAGATGPRHGGGRR